MFVVLLKLVNKAQASVLLEAHKAWIQQGFDDRAFLLVGNLQPSLGGVVVAMGVTRDALEQRLSGDPFVAEGIVRPEIIEIAPSRADPRLGFLVGA